MEILRDGNWRLVVVGGTHMCKHPPKLMQLGLLVVSLLLSWNVADLIQNVCWSQREKLRKIAALMQPWPSRKGQAMGCTE